MKGNLRKIQLQLDNNSWEDIDFKELKKGYSFRMFEPNGNPVIDSFGDDVFEADSNTYFSEELETFVIDIK